MTVQAKHGLIQQPRILIVQLKKTRIQFMMMTSTKIIGTTKKGKNEKKEEIKQAGQNKNNNENKNKNGKVAKSCIYIYIFFETETILLVILL